MAQIDHRTNLPQRDGLVRVPDLNRGEQQPDA